MHEIQINPYSKELQVGGPTPTPSPAHGLQKEVHFIIMDVPVSMHWYTHIKINKNITQHLYKRLKRVHLKKGN